MNFKCILLIAFSFFAINGKAQVLDYAKQITQELCSEKYAGRGYVDDGVNKAANFLANEFGKLKLKKTNYSYFQEYAFSVNTHPFPISCKVDNNTLEVGKDFIIEAGSKSINGTFQLVHFNSKDSVEKLLLSKKIQQGFSANEALVLHKSNSRNSHILDSCKLYNHFPALFIFTEEKKLTHTISTELDNYASIIFMDSVIVEKELLKVEAINEFIPKQICKNIIGSIKGKNTDSFVVFSAHYDHLGKQGNAIFPGASDNASGVSMVLNLAKYYSKNKPQYTTYFILFSGEEAGLIGSNYFTEYPTFSIEKIKMLVNIDIMGSAENGITVVNGETFKPQFDLLNSINKNNNFLPEVKIRGKAANSDHYFFSEKGIPSFFIYSMGGQGYYHDIFDKAEVLKFENYENVFKLLTRFYSEL